MPIGIFLYEGQNNENVPIAADDCWFSFCHRERNPSGDRAVNESESAFAFAKAEVNPDKVNPDS